MDFAAIVIAAVAAVFSGWAAWSAHGSKNSAKQSVEEVRKARLDSQAPAVFVEKPEPQRERWNLVPLGDSGRHHPPVADPGRTFESPGNDDVRILIGAHLTIRNEGSVSAQMSVSGAIRVYPLDEMGFGIPTKIAIDTPQAEYTLGPGDTQEIEVWSGPRCASGSMEATTLTRSA
ncbi:MAG: hypothetical protein WAM97_15515 [Acidimicrobiales bacterium]